MWNPASQRATRMSTDSLKIHIQVTSALTAVSGNKDTVTSRSTKEYNSGLMVNGKVPTHSAPEPHDGSWPEKAGYS